MVNVTRRITRSWFYFRVGYATYLGFLHGLMNTIILLYFFMVKNMTGEFFGTSLWGLLVMMSISLVFPIAGIVGYIHFKRTPAYASEADITVESNPWYYKLPPGFWREAIGPLLAHLAIELRNKHPDDQGMQENVDDWMLLIAGAEVGRDAKRGDFHETKS